MNVFRVGFYEKVEGENIEDSEVVVTLNIENISSYFKDHHKNKEILSIERINFYDEQVTLI